MADWTTKARHWEFLRPYFERLRGRVSTYYDARFPSSHAVRVGIDVGDWWINVALDRREDRDDTLASLRDALRIVGAFAQLNRDCCLQYLRVFSLWRVAPFVDLDDARFVPRFRISMGALATHNPHEDNDNDDDDDGDEDEDDDDDDSHAFHRALGALLGSSDDDDDDTTSGFARDWLRMKDMADRVGRVPLELQTIELFLDVDTTGVADVRQPMFFHCLSEAIQGIHDLQYVRSRMPHNERVGLPPILSVTTMDLWLTSTTPSLPVLEELRRLVELGVPLNNVALPATSSFLHTQSHDTAWRLAWRELLCALTGRSTASFRRASRIDAPLLVRRVIVPSEYVRGPLLSSTFSALVFARSVGELQIGSMVGGSEAAPVANDEGVEGGDGHAPAGVLSTVDPNFWYWLAWVMLPDELMSPHSIETISLLGARVTDAAMSTLESVARFGPPMRRIAEALVNDVELDSLPLQCQHSTVSICAGTALTLYESNGTEDVTTTKTLTGVVIHNKRDNSPSVLIVPGLGICAVASGVLPMKRARVANDQVVAPPTSAPIKNFKFVSPPRGSQSLPVLKRLVRLVGPSLEGLYIRTQRMTDTTISSFLQLCPHLESLSVTGANISSIDFLWDAYARGCKISSLEFATDPAVSTGRNHHRLVMRTSLETTAMESLLYQLMSHHTPISSTLTRLSLVRHDLRHDLCPLLDDMLANNQSLTHFWFVGCRSFGLAARWIPERHHGEPLRDAPSVPLAQRQRLAFLSVLWHQRQRNQALQLDSFVGSSIFQFAATRQRRSVVRYTK